MKTTQRYKYDGFVRELGAVMRNLVDAQVLNVMDPTPAAPADRLLRDEHTAARAALVSMRSICGTLSDRVNELSENVAALDTAISRGSAAKSPRKNPARRGKS